MLTVLAFYRSLSCLYLWLCWIQVPHIIRPFTVLSIPAHCFVSYWILPSTLYASHVLAFVSFLIGTMWFLSLCLKPQTYLCVKFLKTERVTSITGEVIVVHVVTKIWCKRCSSATLLLSSLHLLTVPVGYVLFSKLFGKASVFCRTNLGRVVQIWLESLGSVITKRVFPLLF